MKDLAHIFEEMAEALAAGQHLLLLSDYDGTLTSIARDPGEAWLPREVRNDLRTLAADPRIHVGIVSGRSVSDLRACVRLPDVIYAGCHGLEVEGPDIAFKHPTAEARRDTLAAIAHTLADRTAALAGVLVEPKGLSVAVHYRAMAPSAAPRLQAALEQVVRPRAAELQLLRGNKVVEILPRGGWNKGHCVLLIRDHVLSVTPAGLLSFYLGDDVTDELAFPVLQGKVLTIRIGGKRIPSAAGYRLRNVADVQRLLSALVAEVLPRSRP